MSDDALPRERTKTIEFAEPIIFNNQTYVGLDLCVPKIGQIKRAQTHLKGTPDSDTRMLTVLISLVARVPEPLVDMIDYDVTLEAGEFLMSFMAPPPKILET